MPVILGEYAAQNVSFWIIAVVMGVAAIGVVTMKNIVHAALALVVVLAGVAAQYILLQAEFLGIVQVLIYIGAVIVLFLFGIMLTRAPMRKSSEYDNDQRVLAGLVAVLIFGVLAYLLVDEFSGDKLELVQPTQTSAIADSIFRSYVVAFEAVSMLLLAALIGAIVLARRD
ncbi:MAG TPA: NADH-quinone oxidoreductase subunit J [Acidimicrobiia bacterium]|nr:NADH-quinone oxidoreductase subunit J [Acidimicrobiia bacterium]